MPPPAPTRLRKTFLHGVVSGIGWAIGATIGFTLLVAVMGTLLSFLSNIPLIKNLANPFVQIIENISDPRDNVVRIDTQEF